MLAPTPPQLKPQLRFGSVPTHSGRALLTPRLRERVLRQKRSFVWLYSYLKRISQIK